LFSNSLLLRVYDCSDPSGDCFTGEFSFEVSLLLLVEIIDIGDLVCDRSRI
jgi:hypothetical protein